MKNQLPDLVLLDIMLPDEDGLTIMGKIRANEETSKLPVIMLTAKTTEIDKVKGLDMGAEVSFSFGRIEMDERKHQVLVRGSDDMTQSSFYYAVKLKAGGILRVSMDAQSLLDVFITSLPILLAVGLSLFILCMIVASFLTKSLVRPIEDMAQNLDNIENIEVYSELAPIAETIRSQHEDIVKIARIRQDFTANVSHELKTPLTVISGYSYQRYSSII